MHDLSVRKNLIGILGKKKSHSYQQRPFSSCFCTGMQTSHMCQFGAGMKIAVMLIRQQISVLFISGIQPPNSANVPRSDANAMPASTCRVEERDLKQKCQNVKKEKKK